MLKQIVYMKNRNESAEDFEDRLIKFGESYRIENMVSSIGKHGELVVTIFYSDDF